MKVPRRNNFVVVMTTEVLKYYSQENQPEKTYFRKAMRVT